MFIYSFFSSGVVSFLEYLHVKMAIIELRKRRFTNGFCEKWPDLYFCTGNCFLLVELTAALFKWSGTGGCLVHIGHVFKTSIMAPMRMRHKVRVTPTSSTSCTHSSQCEQFTVLLFSAL